MEFLYCVPPSSPITQTYEQHIERAKQNGWCYTPSPCPSGRYYYPGIDWGVPVGTSVVASQSQLTGTTPVLRYDTEGYGTHIRLTHEGGFMTIYAHLSAIKINTASRPAAGEVIALSGNTGFSTGPHIHWEVRLNGVPINPFVPPNAVVESFDNEIDYPVIPLLPKATVNCSTLLIRSGPGKNYPSVGSLKGGTTFDVIEYVFSGTFVWLRIGYNQWCAMRDGYNQLCKWVK